MRPAHFFLLTVLICVIISPCMAKVSPSGIYQEAGTFEMLPGISGSYNTTPGMALGNIVFSDIQLGTTVDFTLFYGMSNVKTGQIIYEPVNIGVSRSTVIMGGNSSVRDFIDTHSFKQMKVSGYAKDTYEGGIGDTTGFGIWDNGLGIWSDQVAYEAVPDRSNNLIHSISYTSNNPVKVTFSYGEESYIAEQSSKTAWDIINEWLSFATSIATSIYEVALELFYWLKFFFWDNLEMTVALYLAVTMAFAARSSRGNPQVFLRRWFKDQVGFFNFILNLWRTLIELIAQFRSIFRL